MDGGLLTALLWALGGEETVVRGWTINLTGAPRSIAIPQTLARGTVTITATDSVSVSGGSLLSNLAVAAGMPAGDRSPRPP